MAKRKAKFQVGEVVYWVGGERYVQIVYSEPHEESFLYWVGYSDRGETDVSQVSEEVLRRLTAREAGRKGR